jgi:cell division protein ZapD
VIIYEYPFNERIRTLLRLEDLFEKAAYFQQKDGAYEHHVGLLSLFEILEVAGRADLKMDLIQELERQRQALLVYRNNPDISEDALSGALYEIEQASAALLSLTGKFGQHLRENDWLMGIKSRAVIPGGVCEFDLPAYHFWRNQSVAKRQAALERWTAPLVPVREALVIILRMLRSSGRARSLSSSNGVFQQMLGGSMAQMAQMVRVAIPVNVVAVPEVSANKYALNIRFICPNESGEKQRVCDHDIDFQLTLCNL